MDINEFEALVKSITYKPGSRISFVRDPFLIGCSWLRISLKVPDAYVAREDVTIGYSIVTGQCVVASGHGGVATGRAPDQMPPHGYTWTYVGKRWMVDDEMIDRFGSEEAALAFIETCIFEIEEHEMREWFKVRGKRIKNPHPERARMTEKEKQARDNFTRRPAPKQSNSLGLD